MSGLTDGAPAVGVPRRRLDFPARARGPAGFARAMYLLAGLALFPVYWAAGAFLRVPGSRFRWECFRAGVRCLRAGRWADAYHCIVSPLDSVRHFEMDFFWRRIRTVRPVRVLDVSSPRLLTMALLRSDAKAHADMLNPDVGDLARTRLLASALGVADRCRFLGRMIDDLPEEDRGYPMVTCMSVLEHIVDDMAAIRTMWERIAPGGRLLLSVPCAAQAIEEYSNIDDYGLLERDEAGYVFWQRYYDEARLRAIFAITGMPVSRAVYAERVPGAYDADVRAKRTNPFYPRWREPWATARAYARRDDVATLPGMGVIALEFIKSPSEQ